jgi:hypothetical protein
MATSAVSITGLSWKKSRNRQVRQHVMAQEMTHRKSSYLQYLPPVLWMGEPEAPEFSLGRFLLAFEHILTGLDDQPAIAHTGY